MGAPAKTVEYLGCGSPVQRMPDRLNALVVGENTFGFHRLEIVGPLLEATLAEAQVDPTITTDRNQLQSENIQDYDVVVDFITDSTFTDAQLNGLLSFIEAGGGYVGIHCAADLHTTPDDNREEPQPDLREVIGGHFITHPEHSTFEVSIVDSHHPITADVDRFRLWDEPYQLEYDDSVRILARMDHPSLADMPVLWINQYGDGQPVYLSLGHGQTGHATAGVRQLIQNSVRWAAVG